MRYLDFDLEIGPGTGRSYPLVVRSATGDARTTMQFPYDDLALKDKLKDLHIALLQSSQTQRALTDEEQAVQDFGQQLFEALFAGVAGNLFYGSRTTAAQGGLLGVRLRLNVQAPELAGLPWEYLYDPNQREYLCLSRMTPIVRYPELAQPLQPLLVTPPLRILAMIASPNDQDRLDITREKTRMEEALKELNASSQIELTWLPGQTWEDLQEAMWHGPWHIFHFIGHGGYDKRADEGLIALCDEEGQTQLLGARDLARLLTVHSALRLVVLNACEGAKGGSHDLFSSTAATLAKRGIPAVLAMQEAITDKAAIQLTRTFYRALATGLPVDAAVAEARTAISVRLRHSLEWGTPVLFLRAPDSMLFMLNDMPTGTPVLTPNVPSPPAWTESAKLEPIPQLESSRTEPARGVREAPPMPSSSEPATGELPAQATQQTKTQSLVEKQTPTSPASPKSDLSAAASRSSASRMMFELPPLPYDFSALEPYIDTQTMQLHHDKHHATYVVNLNYAVRGTQFEHLDIEELMRRINEVPENIRTAVRNNGGGHVNHTMFWEIMKPNGGGQPTGALAEVINQTFGGFEQFKMQLNDAAIKRSGSGWSWLVASQSSKLQIISTANQDSPFMDGLFPIMGIDLWEHAYYLKYQNRRADYVYAWWNVANWDVIARRFERAKGGR